MQRNGQLRYSSILFGEIEFLMIELFFELFILSCELEDGVFLEVEEVVELRFRHPFLLYTISSSLAPANLIFFLRNALRRPLKRLFFGIFCLFRISGATFRLPLKLIAKLTGNLFQLMALALNLKRAHLMLFLEFE